MCVPMLVTTHVEVIIMMQYNPNRVGNGKEVNGR